MEKIVDVRLKDLVEKAEANRIDIKKLRENEIEKEEIVKRLSVIDNKLIN